MGAVDFRTSALTEGTSVVAGGVGGVSGSASFLTGNIVLSPDARNIPPPTRLGFALSRACLTSLKVRGGSLEFLGGEGDVTSSEGMGSEAELVFKDREDTA